MLFVSHSPESTLCTKDAIMPVRDSVRFLRRMTNLQSLCLRGNKFSPVPPNDGANEKKRLEKIYKRYCFAFLPSVVYLDFTMITDEDVSTCTNMCIVGTDQCQLLLN